MKVHNPKYIIDNKPLFPIILPLGTLVLHTNGYSLILFVYVNDLVITGNNIDLILKLKKKLVDSFDMIDLGTMHYLLGLQVLPLCDGFFISKSKYVIDLLTCFNMEDCKPSSTLFQLKVKLNKTCQTPKVDATLY
jgi:hypothetical protein